MQAAKTKFYALRGERNDGHLYIPELYDKGVRQFVVSTDFDASSYPDAHFEKADRPLRQLQQVVREHRQQFDLPVIGITGSNGKTIIKEWLYQLLSPDYNIIRSPRSYNSQIGVPLSVWGLEAQHELGIFEAGISQPGEMEYIAPIIDCQIGILTNIGAAHDAGFQSRNEKLQEKLLLFKNAQTIIYCSDHKLVSDAIVAFKDKQLLDWSFENEKAFLYISNQELIPEKGYKLVVQFHDQPFEFLIPFYDEASVENLLHCITTLLHLGIKPEIINDRIEELRPIEMRLELKSGINHCELINDSYSADLSSLTIALQFMEQQSREAKKTIILSDFLESGLSPTALYSQVAQLLEVRDIDRLIGIGTDISEIYSFFTKKIETHFYQSTEAFLVNLHQHTFQEEVILLKGARIFTFERIASRLEQKIHSTRLEVDLDALIHNFNEYARLLHPQTKIMVMVKAAAYGSGSIEVARLLEARGADYLAVVYTDEGVELRKAGIKMPIMVLNPEVSGFNQLIDYQLEPEIYSIELLKELIHFLNDQAIDIHLKVDTGMRRLGFEEDQLEQLCQLLLDKSFIHVKSIFSHLASSEDPKEDAFTTEQFARFDQYYALIAKKIGYQPSRHILNSNGISRFPARQMEMVRLGIGLYGKDNSPEMQSRLRVVHELKATISQVKTIKTGETIGYGRMGRAEQRLRIATINIGYADGLSRMMGNGHFQVIVHQKKAPTIGNICMDMCMIDITHIPQASRGDEVLIFGHAQPIETFANAMQTIPYEVFTRISNRVKRIYFSA